MALAGLELFLLTRRSSVPPAPPGAKDIWTAWYSGKRSLITLVGKHIYGIRQLGSLVFPPVNMSV